MTEEIKEMSNDSEKSAVFISMYGKVQGVGFRKKLKIFCDKVGLFGWVQNMRSGSVEAFLEGPQSAIDAVMADLHLGKMSAKIYEMTLAKCMPVGVTAFTIHPTKAELLKDLEVAPIMLDQVKLLSKASSQINSYLMRLSSSGAAEDKKKYEAELSEIARTLPNRYLGEPLVQRQKRLPFKLTDVAPSFASECWNNKAFNRVLMSRQGTTPEMLLDNKILGQEFIRQLGLRLPEVYQVDVPLAEIKPRPGVVIKPVRASGSKGVYSFKTCNEIYHLGENKELHSIEEFRLDAAQTLEKIKRPDRWMCEELILNFDDELPNDLKMLTFYGRVAIVQEATRLPTRVCYYDRAGNPISTGRYLNLQFEGTGVLPEYIDLAEKISQKIPMPFCRIDFLKAKDGPVFGEFTPKPGNFHQFDEKTDTFLGAEYIKARARLVADLLQGKVFQEYNHFVASVNQQPSRKAKSGRAV